jgi:hypothetical protein
MVQARVMLLPPDETVHLPPGTWLMLLGEEPFHILDRGDWFAYRLPSGECVLRQDPLDTDEAEIVDDPQVIELMTTARPVEEAVFDAYNLFYEPIYAGFPPFRILKCRFAGARCLRRPKWRWLFVLTAWLSFGFKRQPVTRALSPFAPGAIISR